jgi:hypothetical protein
MLARGYTTFISSATGAAAARRFLIARRVLKNSAKYLEFLHGFAQFCQQARTHMGKGKTKHQTKGTKDRPTKSVSPSKKQRKGAEAAAQQEAAESAAAEAAAMTGVADEEDEEEEEAEGEPGEESEGEGPPVSQAAKERSVITDQAKEVARLKELAVTLQKQLDEVLSRSYSFNFNSYLIFLMAEGRNASHPCLCRKAQEEIRLTPNPAGDCASRK